MSDKIELKPCPYCGGDDIRLTEDARDHGYMFCDVCFARGPCVDQVGNWQRPHEAWNTRVPDPALAAKDATITELRKALERIAKDAGDYSEKTWFRLDMIKDEARAALEATR